MQLMQLLRTGTLALVQHPQPQQPQPKYLTSREVMALLRCSMRTLRRRCAKRLLTFVQDGGRYLFPSSDVDRYLAQRTTKHGERKEGGVNNLTVKHDSTAMT